MQERLRETRDWSGFAYGGQAPGYPTGPSTSQWRDDVPADQKEDVMAFILWILAVVLVVSGIVSLFRGEMLWGIVLIIVGLLVGPGGVSIFT